MSTHSNATSIAWLRSHKGKERNDEQGHILTGCCYRRQGLRLRPGRDLFPPVLVFDLRRNSFTMSDLFAVLTEKRPAGTAFGKA